MQTIFTEHQATMLVLNCSNMPGEHTLAKDMVHMYEDQNEGNLNCTFRISWPSCGNLMALLQPS